MALSFPYTYIQCPCASDAPIAHRTPGTDADHPADDGAAQPDEERTFDPHAPGANFSLYPLEYLHYCEDCHQIRCPRCVLDEIVTWYCPNCLFEVPSSTVKSEGNRCTRSCFQCPICIAPLSVTSIETSSNSTLLPVEPNAHAGPWVLSCSSCTWSSQDIGITFEKSNGIYSQLARVKNGGEPVRPPDAKLLRHPSIPMDEYAEYEDAAENLSPVAEEPEEDEPDAAALDAETQFARLKSFYASQLAESTAGGGKFSFSTGDFGYGSPGSLSRIMSLYTGNSGFGGRKARAKDAQMREAMDTREGLQLLTDKTDTTIEQLAKQGWDATTSRSQRSLQVPQHSEARFVADLRPVPYLLRTKRSKRCRTCRHILAKPESKVQTTRYRIRLVALNYLPSLSIKLLQPPSSSGAPAATAPGAPLILKPLRPVQFLLTLKNPLFEPIKITLATPARTPGRFASRVTILCPQFEVGASTDVWDEALNNGSLSDRRATKDLGEAGAQGQAEAGKVWERGRNWVSVVVEVVPAALDPELNFAAALSSSVQGMRPPATPAAGTEAEREASEDEEILEIPVFVRAEWEADAAGDETSALGKDVDRERSVKESSEKRELAYWCVLGVGKISRE